MDTQIAKAAAGRQMIEHTSEHTGRHDDYGVSKRKERLDDLEPAADTRPRAAVKSRRRLAYVGQIRHVAPHVDQRPDNTVNITL